MNDYKNFLTGDTARAWKQLRGRFYWLNDSEIAEHLIEVHEQWCGNQCPLLKSCDQQKSGSETSCDRPDVIPFTQSNRENANTSVFTDVIPSTQSKGENANTSAITDVIPSTQFNRENSNTSVFTDVIPCTQSNRENANTSVFTDVIPSTQSNRENANTSVFTDVIPSTQSNRENANTSAFTDVIPSTQSNGENSNTSVFTDVIPSTQSKGENSNTSVFTDVIPCTQSNEENKNISLQLEVDEGAESVDDDSSNDGYHDPASEEEDIKQEPEFMDCTPQNGDSKGDEVFPLSTSEWTDSGGNHLSQAIPVVKQEPTDNGEYENSVIQNVETTQTKTVSYHRTQLTGAVSHPIMSDTNVGVVKQEPTDSGEYENSVTKSVATSERIVSYQDKPLVSPGAPASLSVMSSNIVTSSGAPASLSVMSSDIVTSSSGAPALQSVMSTNTIASVKPAVNHEIPSTNTTILNPLGMGPQSLLNPFGMGPQSLLNPVGTGPHSVLNPLGTGPQSVLNPLLSGPQSVFSIIPGVNVAQTPTVLNPAVVGAQTLLPGTPGITQTINLATSGNVVPPQHLNVVRRGNSLFLESASALPSAVPPNLQNPLFTFAHPVGLNRQSDFYIPPTIPVAANISNVGQGGLVALQPTLVSELSSSGQQASTLSESPSVLNPVTTPLRQETPSTNILTGSLSRRAGSKQTDEYWKQMDEKDEERLENSRIAGEVSSRTRRMKRRQSEKEKGPSTSKRFVSETEGEETEVEEDQPKDTNVSRKGRMAVSASEKQRRYRQRRDQDPIRRAEYLTKERKKYQQMKECGKVKLIKDMSEGEQRCARKNWRNNKRNRRARQMLCSLTHPLAVVKRIQVHKQSEKREKEADNIERLNSYKKKIKSERKIDMYRERVIANQNVERLITDQNVE